MGWELGWDLLPSNPQALRLKARVTDVTGNIPKFQMPQNDSHLCTQFKFKVCLLPPCRIPPPKTSSLPGNWHNSLAKDKTGGKKT